jgi:nucleoside-diphosphate-sugar epimerase
VATSLVLGASGAVGRFLLPRLAARGERVLALSRHPQPDAPGVEWIRGDLSDPALAGRLPPLSPGDAVFSLGPLDAFARCHAATPTLAAARVVALGSMSAISKQASADPGERVLAARLRAAEADLLAGAARHGGACTVLRATLIYGAGVDRSLGPLARFALRWRVFPLLRDAGGLRQPVHAEDLAGACLAALDHLPRGGRVYALGGGERLTLAAMLERVRASLPVRTLPLRVTVPLARRLVGLARRAGVPLATSMLDRATTDLVADDAPARADFGWSPRPFQPDAAAWGLQGPRAEG